MSDSDKYMPGVWRCAKCKFRLVQSNLNALDGTITPRDEPGDTCPNCKHPLWRVSWREEATENLLLAERLMERVALLEAALRPFAQEAEAWPDYCPDGDGVFVAAPDDVLPLLDEIASEQGRRSAGISYSDETITVGDLRRARACLATQPPSP